MIAPLYLLADSQLLFSQADDNAVTSGIRAQLPSSDAKAAYIGASNHDRAEFYDLFVAAMGLMGISNCRMVPRQMTDEDMRFAQEANLVLLAGGDVEDGWHVFEQNGLKDLILKKRYDGSVFVGVSAGAVQLGLGALTDAEQPKRLETFGFAPFYVGAHEEKDEWWNLRALVNLSETGVRGVGIAMGGGAIYWPDGTLEPVRRPLVELVKGDDGVVERLLLPPEPAVKEPVS
ncbi:MAG: Type 1 glutamine amidotransferase-like domain-containing protein [Candidatus Sulfotelmatobacter sp.]